jgi:hypothetical protein
MKRSKTSSRTRRLRTHGAPGRIHSTHRFLPAALLAASCGLAALSVSSLRADTIFLKDGTQILDCQVTSETATAVSVRTPVGDMVVPRTEIYRIQRQRTVHDTYAEQLARIREGDANGLFKLAQWCRSANGLRKESDELLAQVIALQENHAGARRLLGHVKSGDKWIVPAPLSIRLVAGGGSGKDENDLREKLALFLQSRRDVRVAPESAGDSREPGDPFDACTVRASVVIGRRAGTKFYGETIGRASIVATVSLSAESPWIGKTPAKVAVAGEIPEGVGGGGAVAVQNALGSNSQSLHRFLDQVAQLRSRALERELAKKETEKKKAAGAADPAV